jgi:diguanylate cyclase (GGDEF)-like protein
MVLAGLIGVVYTLVTLFAKPSQRLNAFGDVAQLVLALLVTFAFALPIRRSKGRVRSFWILMTAGVACWFVSQAIWLYYELLSPSVNMMEPSIQDMVLFLHLIPMMAALATLPHLRRKMPPMIPYSLGMLAVWWMYLYFYAVIPWQYVSPDALRYGRDFNTLYSIQDFSFILILGGMVWHAQGPWRTLYRRLLMGSLGYTISSLILNEAINQRRYYTGSWFDLPLVFSIICIAWSAASARTPEDCETPQDGQESVGANWLAHLTFAALLSVPLLAAWALKSSNDPLPVRHFRVGVSLVATVTIGILLFMVQWILRSRLAHSLAEVRKSNEELCRAREALHYQATHDGMTHCLNRAAIAEALRRELARAQRSGKRVATLLIDLDHFKEINDRYGHHAGDIAIVAACTRMQDSLRSHDLVGRYGGEEFLVVIPEADFSTAMQIAERIRKHVSAEPIQWQNQEITVTATLGIALSRPADDSEQLLRRADLALYEGKSISRDTVRFCAQDAQLPA